MNDSKQSSVSWGQLIVGILFVITALLSLQNPLVNLISFAMILSISAILKGIFEIFLRNQIKELTGYKTYLPIVLGVINIIVGVYFLIYPMSAVTITPFIFSIWFISDSVVRLFTLDGIKKISKGYYWFSLVVNILGILLGISLLFDPVSSALTLSFLIATYFMIYGISSIVGSFNRHK